MKRKPFALLLILSALLSGCMQQALDNQVIMQNIMLSADTEGKCWVLVKKVNSEEYRHLVKYFSTPAAYKSGLVFEDTFFYGPTTTEQVRLNGDYKSWLKIDNDLDDCDDEDFDVEDEHHLFFSASDYPDFMKKKRHEFIVGGNNEYEISESDYNHGATYDTTFYYYEELYFLPDGRFRKKIYLDEECNFVTVTGNWIFKSPFMTTSAGSQYSEIIIDYDIADWMSLPSTSNLYRITGNGSGALSIEQDQSATDSSFLATRGSYTIKRDVIVYYPQHDSGNYTFGKVVKHLEAACTSPTARPDDLLTIKDDLTLLKEKRYHLKSEYVKAKPRCPSIPSSGSCPELCGHALCGSKQGKMYDSDNTLLSTHNSSFSVPADSSVIVISNFANLNENLAIPMATYYWDMCHAYTPVTITFGSTTLIFSGLSTGTDEPITVTCSINGEPRYVKYE